MNNRVIDRLVERMQAMGVKHIYGVPGGGSSLDLIEAAARVGIEFVLCRSETAAALMAAVGAELTDIPGVVLTGIGPSAASVVNGIAYASLERAPLILITDTDEQNKALSPHQVFDQLALFAPICKGGLRLDAENAATGIDRLIDATLTHPRGPVHFDLSVKNARASIKPSRSDETETESLVPDQSATAEDIARLLRDSQRPVLLVGLQTRQRALSEQLRRFSERLNCPVLVSYKAKGVVAESDPLFVGTFTGATAESELLARADLILSVGLDPIEMIPSPWRYDAPVVVIMQGVSDAFPFSAKASLDGDLTSNIDALTASVNRSTWTLDEIAGLRTGLRERLSLKGEHHTADTVIDTLASLSPDARLTVDAGAHMFSAMARWPAAKAHDVLKSNGLSTMGYALPAAIASGLVDPERPVIAVTGDGGMLMCLAELSTATRLNISLTVVVLNDAALSLIDIKQQHNEHPVNGVRYAPVDFAEVARGMGCKAWKVNADESLEQVLELALASAGTKLVDVTVDPSGYAGQLAALRR
ncbi:MAG: thiamine pyrophosphate-binding protein [Gammaproteobacteria bacterium]|nr:thiamine pyrophosphate-binding protein [Gammaproteobacteria bacterium]